MLRRIDDISDEGIIYLCIASRRMSEVEQEEIRQLTNSWLEEWNDRFTTCPVSGCHILLDATVVVWAMDERPRGSPVGVPDLSPEELASLFDRYDEWQQTRRPPIRFYLGTGTIIQGHIWPMIQPVGMLVAEGHLTITEDTLIVNSCTVAEWRAGKFLQRVKDNPAYHGFLSYRN